MIEKTFRLLKAESQKIPMISPEGIRRSKGGVVTMTKRIVPLTESSQEVGERHNFLGMKVASS